MSGRRSVAALVLGGALLAGGLAAQEPAAAQSPFKPFDQGVFETAMKQAGASEAQLEAFRARVTEESAAAATEQLLQELHVDYAAAAQQAAAGEPIAALSLAKLLAATSDPFLKAHARYRLGRVFLDADDPDRAVDIFSEYLRESINRTPLDAEAVFYYAHALAAVPMPEDAVSVFAAFLQHFPNAPERFVAAAVQQRAELETQVDSPLHNIADIMKNCERRIRRTDTGKETQDRQQQVITQLEKIIEEIEKREKSGGAPGGNNPNNPAKKSALPGGASKVGNLGKANTVVERWGLMKDRDREAIENDLQTKLPGRYRQLLQDYYKRLNAGGQ